MDMESIVKKSYILTREEALRVMGYRYLKGETIEFVEIYTIDIAGLERYRTLIFWYLVEGVNVFLCVEKISTILENKRYTRLADTVIEEYMLDVFKDRVDPGGYNPTYHDLVIHDNLLHLVNNHDSVIALNILIHYLRLVCNKVIPPRNSYLMRQRKRHMLIGNYVFIYKTLASLYLKLCLYYGTEVFTYQSSTLRIMMNHFIHYKGGVSVKIVRC